MHVTLEQLNLLLTRKASPEERDAMSDHILECDTCAARFRALHGLDRGLSKPALPLRYVLGVAAVMLMCLIPYFSSETSLSPMPDADGRMPAVPTFAVIDKVAAVNYQQALANWGNRSDTRELVRLRNHLAN